MPSASSLAAMPGPPTSKPQGSRGPSCSSWELCSRPGRKPGSALSRGLLLARARVGTPTPLDSRDPGRDHTDRGHPMGKETASRGQSCVLSALSGQSCGPKAFSCACPGHSLQSPRDCSCHPSPLLPSEVPDKSHSPRHQSGLVVKRKGVPSSRSPPDTDLDNAGMPKTQSPWVLSKTPLPRAGAPPTAQLHGSGRQSHRQQPHVGRSKPGAPLLQACTRHRHDKAQGRGTGHVWATHGHPAAAQSPQAPPRCAHAPQRLFALQRGPRGGQPQVSG